MKVSNSILLITSLIAINLSAFCQDKNSIGLKAGLNLASYSSDLNSTDFKNKIGFYAGGLFQVGLSESIKFQSELLFSVQRTSVDTEVEITDILGNPLPSTQPYDFEYHINEFIISVPLMVKVYAFNKFYFEAGPIFNFIIDKTFTSDLILLNGTFPESINENYDTFDFAVGLGLGYDFSDSLSTNFRVNPSLTTREDGINVIIFNFGLEYKFK